MSADNIYLVVIENYDNTIHDTEQLMLTVFDVGDCNNYDVGLEIESKRQSTSKSALNEVSHIISANGIQSALNNLEYTIKTEPDEYDTKIKFEPDPEEEGFYNEMVLNGDIVVEIKKEEPNDTMERDFEENKVPAWPEQDVTCKVKTKQKLPIVTKDTNILRVFRDLIIKVETRKPPPIKEIPYIEEEEGIYQCKYCEHSINNMKTAIRHYRFRHGPRINRCLACGAGYRRHDYLLKHETICHGENADVLRKARSLVVKKTMSRKERRSIKEPCNLCGKMICHANMKLHLAVHSDVRRYACTECPVRFRTSRALQAHLNAHRGERPYRCDQCPNAYTSDTALRAHKMDHSSDTFDCDYCGKGFTRKYSLVQHMRIHTGERRFLCSECGAAYAHGPALAAHLRRHAGLPPPHACMECHKSFGKMSLLKIHLKKKHGINIITRKMFFNQLPQMVDGAAIKPDNKIIIPARFEDAVSQSSFADDEQNEENEM